MAINYKNEEKKTGYSDGKESYMPGDLVTGAEALNAMIGAGQKQFDGETVLLNPKTNEVAKLGMWDGLSDKQYVVAKDMRLSRNTRKPAERLMKGRAICMTCSRKSRALKF